MTLGLCRFGRIVELTRSVFSQLSDVPDECLTLHQLLSGRRLLSLRGRVPQQRHTRGKVQGAHDGRGVSGVS